MTGPLWLGVPPFLLLLASGLAVSSLPRMGSLFLQAGAGVALVVSGIMGLLGPPFHMTLGPVGFGWTLTLGLDPLSSFFVLLLGLVALPATFYANSYFRHETPGKDRFARALIPLFLLSMAGVLASEDAISFLFFWELMSLVSFALVVTDHTREPVRRAGFVYLVSTHLGALAVVLVFGLLDRAHLGLAFATYAAQGHSLPVALRSALLLLGLLGFGSKAAVVPLHIWLPRAHPVAPSPVSALMSGVMVKIAIYALLRLTLSWLGAGPLWWGFVLLLLGALSALAGALYALAESDLKRLLAFSTIENVGIILLGLGAAMIARTSGQGLLATVAVSALLFHALNHALLKGGLFLGAGSVGQALGTQEIDRMGGLGQRMPWTAGAFVILSLGLAGLPPLGAFASEWLTFQALFRLAHLSQASVAALAVAGALALALTGGLAAAVFVKAAGTAFLGPARSPEATRAREVPAAMWVTPVSLVGLSLLLGLLPGIGVMAGLKAAGAVLPTPIPGNLAALSLWTPWSQPIWPAFLILAAFALLLGVGRALTPSHPAQTAPAWACGGELGAVSAPTGTSFAKPFRQIFHPVYQTRRSVTRQRTLLPYLHDRVAYESRIRHLTESYLYRPLEAGGLRLSTALRRFQSGSLRTYLAYLFLALAALLFLPVR